MFDGTEIAERDIWSAKARASSFGVRSFVVLLRFPPFPEVWWGFGIKTRLQTEG